MFCTPSSFGGENADQTKKKILLYRIDQGFPTGEQVPQLCMSAFQGQIRPERKTLMKSKIVIIDDYRSFVVISFLLFLD